MQAWWDWMAVGSYILAPRTVLGRAWRLLLTTVVAILLLPLAAAQKWLHSRRREQRMEELREEARELLEGHP